MLVAQPDIFLNPQKCVKVTTYIFGGVTPPTWNWQVTIHIAYSFHDVLQQTTYKNSPNQPNRTPTVSPKLTPIKPKGFNFFWIKQPPFWLLKCSAKPKSRSISTPPKQLQNKACPVETGTTRWSRLPVGAFRCRCLWTTQKPSIWSKG